MDIFEFHTGYKPEQHNNNNVIDCPFCEKQNHFYYNRETFLWECKVCHKSGNALTFIREFYEQFENLTKTAQFISDLRGLPISAVAEARIKYNPLNASYLIPTFKHDKINNLYKLTLMRKQKDGVWSERWVVLASPSPLEHTLMNWDETTPDTLWIAEGQFDRIAAKAIVGSNDIGVVGVPGSGVWKNTWCEYLSDKDIVFCYDNDEPGRTGYEAVILKHIATSQFKPRSISYIKWPEDKPEKYDLNDCYREYGKGSFTKLSEWITPYSQPDNVIIVKNTNETIEADHSCQSFEDLLTRYESVYHTTDSMRMALLLVISSIYSIKIEGEQIWVRLIGAPSSGKTTIAKCVSASPQVVLKSTFTGLFSGFKKDDGTDSSLVPLISGKTLIVKDADALLRQPNIEKIFSELRDFYDKDSSTFYRHGVSHDYRNIRSTMILCGTQFLRRSDQSFLGERFMDFELELSEVDREKIEQKMLERSIISATTPASLPPETPVMAAAKGFLELLMQREQQVEIGPRERENILSWARLAATMRTKVDRETFGQREITFEPVVEVSARLIGQMTKLYTCATTVMGCTKPPEIVHKLIQMVGRYSIDFKSPRMRICQHILKEFASRDEIAERTGFTIEKVNRELGDLVALKLIVAQKFGTGVAGRNTFKFKLIDRIRDGIINIGGE